jgi:WD40 repeat protein
MIRVFENLSDTNTPAWTQTFSLEKHINEIRCLAFSADGSSLFSGANDQMIYRWNPNNGEFLNEIGRNPGFVRSLVFSPSGEALASASGAGTLRLWNPDGKILKENTPFEDYFTGLAFSPDGSLLVGSAENSYLWFFDGTTLERLAYIKAHDGDINSVAFSPDGSLLASGSDDKTIKVWQVNRRDNGIELVLLNTLQMEKDYSVYDVLFSPDGKMLASSSVNGPVLLWGIPE